MFGVSGLVWLANVWLLLSTVVQKYKFKLSGDEGCGNTVEPQGLS